MSQAPLMFSQHTAYHDTQISCATPRMHCATGRGRETTRALTVEDRTVRNNAQLISKPTSEQEIGTLRAHECIARQILQIFREEPPCLHRTKVRKTTTLRHHRLYPQTCNARPQGQARKDHQAKHCLAAMHKDSTQMTAACMV